MSRHLIITEMVLLKGRFQRFFSAYHRPVLYVALLIPGSVLWWQAWRGALGIDPVVALERGLGLWAFRFLQICVALQPLSRSLDYKKLLTYRRMIGLTAFFYVCAHVSAFVLIDLAGNWQEVFKQISYQRFMQFGAFPFFILSLLALTSNQFSMKQLRRQWKNLHRLVYPALIAALIHFILTYKTWTEETVFYSAVTFCILAARFVSSQTFRRLKQWRKVT